MTNHMPALDLADHSGLDLNRTRRPCHDLGRVAYCPTCGMGADSEREAQRCCAKMVENEKRHRTGHERG